jgi:hypothetical protein
MLANDVSARKKAAAISRQETLDSHLTQRPPTDRVVQYSETSFRAAAIEWLVSTDQV